MGSDSTQFRLAVYCRFPTFGYCVAQSIFAMVASRQANPPKACPPAPPFVAEGGGAFSYLLLLKFYGLRNSHGRHFVTDYAVLIGKRLGVIAAGENCHIGLIFIIF